ncbi:MAG: ABC transporter permease [Candidatus Hydrogenedentes bacterium]|nr:ABC transporter permease [Candidatus Hydrogenedentota bacterium]
MLALIRQELIRHMRGRRLLVWMLTLLIISCVVIVYFWPSPPPPGVRRWAYSTWSIGMSSRSMVEVFFLLLAGAAALIVPAYGGGGVALEREHGTYDQLRLTPIFSASIVFGKLVSILGLFAFLLVSILPAMASTYFLLGVDIKVIGQIVAAVCIVAVSSASIGLACSAACQRVIAAQTLTFLIVFVLLSTTTALLPVSIAPLPSILGMGPFTELAPFRAVQSAVMGAVTRDQLLAFTIAHGAIAGVAVLAAAVLISLDYKLYRPRGRNHVENVHARFSRRMRRPIPGWLNPFMVRELRHGELMSWRWQLRLVVVTIALIVASSFAIKQTLAAGNTLKADTWIATLMMLALFLVPGMAASSVVQERERLTYEFLLMTGRRPSGIFLGKVIGVLGSMGGVLLPCLASLAIAPLVIPTIDLRDAAIFTTGFISLLVWMFVCACAAMYVCASTTKPTVAFAASYALCILLYTGFGIGLIAVGMRSPALEIGFVSPVLGFIVNVSIAGKEPIAQFSAYWITHVFSQTMFGLIFIFLALRAAEPFADPIRRRWE